MLSQAQGLILLGAALGTALGAEEQGFELLVKSVGEEVPRTCIEAPNLPSFVRGAFIVSGPALFEQGGYSFQAVFDGFGRVNRFEVKDGKVCYTSAWLATGALKAANASGNLGRGMLFEETVPPRPPCPLMEPMCNANGANDNNWVYTVPLGGGKALFMSDTTKILQMDLNTLQVQGLKAWSDDATGVVTQPSWVSFAHMTAVGSAHPVRRPGTHTLVEIMMAAPLDMGLLGMKSYVEVYTFQDNTTEKQPRQHIASVEASLTPYLHSFGVTANYIILPFNLHIYLGKTLGGSLVDAFEGGWNGIRVVDFNGGIQVFDTDPFFHVHIVNSFENASGIIMDLGIYDENPFAKTPNVHIPMLKNKTERDAAKSRSVVRRLHFHTEGLLKGKVTHQDFANPGHSVDFFRINEKFNGLSYCIYYAVEWWHDGETFANMAILKHDVCQGTRTYWKRESVYPGEPSFVPGTSDVEDDGVLVFIALDGQRGRSMYVTLDAHTFEELSVIELPVRIPFTAHSRFVPEELLAVQEEVFV